ncbi:hypothetical protein M514_02575 [Trichuris suis]|uniref:Large ribosomal subunit protein uL15m n=1 Tax=Trichuris suis TaxID=68888 RepID=A0A085MGX5_9BILA|nr:hypothetical protein M513_02575 [Trichuris suis]KFD70997.1 hypothetical protein M514_02575 [Trichuris suis]KHJ48582.1 hypothetical protein D918_00884 [Trichuris suis]
MSAGGPVKSLTERAIEMLKRSPRINLSNVKDNPGARTQGRKVRAKHNKAGQSHKELQVAAKPPLGWIYGDFYRPWTRIWSGEPYNANAHIRREYPPLSLLELQRFIDLGWIDVSEPIDLTTLCNTMQYRCDPMRRQFGVQLTEEGADCFVARVNIEVQWANEVTIAAVERNGGVITTAYYDPISLVALTNPLKFFEKGEPIPKRGFPPLGLTKYYVDAKNRGYLADPKVVRLERIESGQKFGYEPPEADSIDQDPLLSMRKDPLQIFFGLQPGWVVNLRDKVLLKPTDQTLLSYYNNC